MWGLGFTVTSFVKQAENSVERHVMNLGIGLGVFAFLSVVLNQFHIPLDWKIFLFLSIISPAYYYYKNTPTLKVPTLTKSNIYALLVLVIFIFSFYMYAEGAFGYPFLENEDPWGHSVGVKYVSVEKSAFDPKLDGYKIDHTLAYVDPYPPAYDTLLGVLHQTSVDIMWTMKFFNILIICLGLFFFFYFAQQFTKNRKKALLATFILAAIPSYLSHFIWAHSLVVTLIFPMMYAFERSRIDKRWGYIAAVLLAAIWVTQNLSQPIKITTMLVLYIGIVSITHKRWFTTGIKGLVGGLVLAQIWWTGVIARYSWSGFINLVQNPNAYATVDTVASSTGVVSKFIGLLKAITNTGGTGSRAYGFEDFFIAKGQNMINNPIGIGVFLSLITLFGVGYLIWKYKDSIVKKENTYLAVALFWLIFTFWGVNGQTFPISVARGPFRVWMLLAIPIAFIAAEGIFGLMSLFKNKTAKNLILVILLIGIFMTSATAKYELNTAMWPTSGSFSGGDPATPFEYGAWFSTLEPDTNVFLYAPRDKLTIGYGAYSCAWCQDILDFRETILEKDAQQLHSFLQSHKYEYLVLNQAMDVKYIGKDGNVEKLQQRYNEILQSGLFLPTYQKEGIFIVLRVK